MKDVIISIHSTQAYGTEDEDQIDFTTDGVYEYGDDGSCYVTYYETEITGLAGTRTRMIVTPGGISVNRDGMLTSRMEFEENSRKAFLYNTQYGTAAIGLRTTRIEKNFTPAGGKAIIDYTLDIEHTPLSSNRFEFTVREQKNKNHASM